MISATMDQPHHNAALGTEPVRTIGREELRAKLARGDDFTVYSGPERIAQP